MYEQTNASGENDDMDIAPPGLAPPGLKALAVADTELGGVRGEQGFFHYCQYDATQLARERTLEDVWTLQVDGALPPAVTVIDSRPRSANSFGLVPVMSDLSRGWGWGCWADLPSARHARPF